MEVDFGQVVADEQRFLDLLDQSPDSISTTLETISQIEGIKVETPTEFRDRFLARPPARPSAPATASDEEVAAGQCDHHRGEREQRASLTGAEVDQHHLSRQRHDRDEEHHLDPGGGFHEVDLDRLYHGQAHSASDHDQRHHDPALEQPQSLEDSALIADDAGPHRQSL